MCSPPALRDLSAPTAPINQDSAPEHRRFPLTAIETKPGGGSPSDPPNRARARTGQTIEQRPDVDPTIARLISSEQAVRLRAVPLRVENGRLSVAMLDPSDDAAADEVSVCAGRPVTRFGIPEAILRDLLREHYGTTAAEVAARLSGGAASGDQQADDLVANLEAIDADELHRMAEQPTLINLVNLIILEAVRGRASDVHVEPFEKRLTVKYRIDGVLVEENAPPKRLQPAITSRIKIMAGMNIAERYVPQDGHITLRFEGRKVDIRVSTVPTIYGESVVMRILDKESVQLDLAKLGMRESDRNAMQRLIDLPHGMVLVTGPTGSGKTTTLYAALSKLYDPSLKIITIEDPVEYELSGVNQIPVNPKRGLTFASGLRAILRQDPDVIMVGEIRDKETADIAVRSALTGHLLFSTLHTNDAPSAITRLVDLGVPPYLISATVIGVLAQRLTRSLCGQCRQPDPVVSAELVQEYVSPWRPLTEPQAWKPVGCPACRQTGYRGRTALYELMELSEALRSTMHPQLDEPALRRAAVQAGLRPLRMVGLDKVGRGETTLEEVLRSTPRWEV